MNSKKQNSYDVKRFSSAITACVFTLTVGSVGLLNVPTVEVAGQLYNNQRWGR